MANIEVTKFESTKNDLISINLQEGSAKLIKSDQKANLPEQKNHPEDDIDTAERIRILSIS
jgi:hypothetical protein